MRNKRPLTVRGTAGPQATALPALANHSGDQACRWQIKSCHKIQRTVKGPVGTPNMTKATEG